MDYLVDKGSGQSPVELECHKSVNGGPDGDCDAVRIANEIAGATCQVDGVDEWGCRVAVPWGAGGREGLRAAKDGRVEVSLVECPPTVGRSHRQQIIDGVVGGWDACQNVV